MAKTNARSMSAWHAASKHMPGAVSAVTRLPALQDPCLRRSTCRLQAPGPTGPPPCLAGFGAASSEQA